MNEALHGDLQLSEVVKKLKIHDHVSTIYKSPEQQSAAVAPFFKIGFERGEKCCYVGDDNTIDNLLGAMRDEGIDVDAAMQKGTLTVASKGLASLKRGLFNPEQMVRFWEGNVGEAKAAGFPAVRILGEMAWALGGDVGPERLIEYEARMNRFFTHYDALGVCQYNRNRFSAETILQVLRTHPLVIYDGHVCQNPYYVPPDEFLKPNQKELELHRWLDNIRKYEGVERALRTARDEWEQSFNAISDYVCIVDPSGAILRANRSMRDRFEPVHGDLVGLDYRGVYRGAIQSDSEAPWEAAVSGEAPISFETKLPAADRWYIVSSYPLYDDKSRPLGAVLVVRDITKRKRAEEELQRLSGRLLMLQDEERRKIARDLHDSTGQALVVLATTLGQLRLSVASSNRKVRKLIAESQALADQSIREVRTLAYLLHPPMLDEAGLEDAIRDYVEGFVKRSGIRVKLDLSPDFKRMPRDVELSLFRVVQESLTNIQRHSGSRQAMIRIVRNPKNVTLEVSDNGRKISASGPKSTRGFTSGLGVGIPSMYERVKQIGGRLEIDSRAAGTTVRVTIPTND